jgi:hypothetical protein
VLLRGADVFREPAPGPDKVGSVLLIFCCVVTAFMLRGELPSNIVRIGAVGAGLGIGMSGLFDLRQGLRNLVRADFMALLALYFLTLAEFLAPQEKFNSLVAVESARGATLSCLIAFSGLALGRHLITARRQPLATLLTTPVPGAWLLLAFWACVGLSYLHMLLAVGFNPFKMIYYFLEPRFTQPWTRGQLGGWKELLNEFALLLNLVPPIAGIVLARWRKFGWVQVALVILGLSLTLFYGFTSGTRNVFIIYLVTFVIGYAFAIPPGKEFRLLVLGTLSGTLVLVATTLMLNFRDQGLREYSRTNYQPEVDTFKEFTIDSNMYAIARLVEFYPRYRGYLGMELPYLAMIRPVPRAIWKDKPVGMSMPVEDVMNVEGLTIATSFVGEAYMIYGNPTVFLASLLFGMLAAWWNDFASSKNSELGILIYASGFFAALITMRSFMVFTTTILPTLVAIVIGHFVTAGLARRQTRRRPLPAQHGAGAR